MILVNGNKVEIEYFPNKESKVKEFPVSSEKNVVELFYEDDRDLTHLLFVKNYMDETHYSARSHLVIHYMPYSRMDRKIEGDLYTLKYICAFISDLRFRNIYVIDPHSFATEWMIFVSPENANWDTAPNPVIIIPMEEWGGIVLNEIGFYPPLDCIVLPDNGAYNKYHDMCEKTNLDVRRFDKERCPTTGKILNMKLIEPIPMGCEKVVIIDDICSYGGTFYTAGQILRDMGVNDITLVVTHLEESVFKGNLLYDSSPINRIYTSNSIIRTQTHPKINILPININNYIK